MTKHLTLESIIRKFRKKQGYTTKIVVTKKVFIPSPFPVDNLVNNKDAYPIGIFSSIESAFNAVMHTVEAECDNDPRNVKYWANLNGQIIDIYFFDDTNKIQLYRGQSLNPTKCITYKLYPVTDMTDVYFGNETNYGYRQFLSWRKKIEKGEI